MTSKILAFSLALLALGIGSTSVGAADAAAPPAKTEAKPQVYGSQLMTRQERIEYRNKMRGLKTQEERDAFRAEHHRLMQERAKEKGVTLPETPPPRGAGAGPCAAGATPCPGMGRGMGMGPGGGPNGPAR